MCLLIAVSLKYVWTYIHYDTGKSFLFILRDPQTHTFLKRDKKTIKYSARYFQCNPFRDTIYRVFSSRRDGCLSFEDTMDLCSAFSANCPQGVRAAWAFEIFGKLADDNRIYIQPFVSARPRNSNFCRDKYLRTRRGPVHSVCPMRSLNILAYRVLYFVRNTTNFALFELPRKRLQHRDIFAKFTNLVGCIEHPSCESR